MAILTNPTMPMPTTSLWCCLALLAQDPGVADAVAVRGDTELSPAAALASARGRADEHLRGLWRDRAARLAGAERPLWLPAAVAEAAAARWLATLPFDAYAQVVDRQDRAREHGFGQSHQTTLWVSEAPDALPRGERSLRAAMSAAARDAACRGGAVAGAWAAVGLGVAWFDRLSRGYMTRTLRAVGVLLAIAAPALAFLV